MLGRLGMWCHERRRLVVVAWIAGLLLVGGLSFGIGDRFSTEFTLPNVESAEGFDLLEANFGRESGGHSGSIVFRVAPDTNQTSVDKSGIDRPEVAAAMGDFFTSLDARTDMSVTSPYDEQGARQVSAERTTAFATVNLASDQTSQEQFQVVYNETKAIEPVIDGLQIEYGGQIFAAFEAPSSEVLGLAFAIVILIIAFGSVLAMGLPIGTAFGGIFAGVALMTLLSNVISMPDFTTTIGVMIGLGVGIDYALFIVTRYRECLRRGLTSAHAAQEAIDTAGRAVIFAGTTVVISLLGMLLMQITFMTGLGIGASITVFMTMLASITLLPALLGFVSSRINITRRRGIVATGLVALALIGVGLKINALLVALPMAVIVLIVGSFAPVLKQPLPMRATKPLVETVAYRWSRWIQRHPWASLVVGVGVMATLSVPVLGMRLGFADDGNYPRDTTTRKAYDILAEGFGAGFNGPLTLVTTLSQPQDLVVVQRVSQALAMTPGVAQSSPAIFNDPQNPTAALWTVYPKDAPQSVQVADLVRHLRVEVLPRITQGSGLDVKVTNLVAVSVDFSSFLAGRLPLFFLVVLGMSFILLMAVFRSLLVPLKAVVMNLLSIGAAYGLVVIVFQWGWGSTLIGLGGGAPIDPWLPVMMFAIVFGLSMDYEVFLLSRVKEEYDRTGDNELAVADGLAKTARVITAAALIMAFVFGSFVLDANRGVKMFGFGLAVAVLLDATLVRMLLVPATMQLLGDRNWWIPKWMNRLLPKIDVEGHN